MKLRPGMRLSPEFSRAEETVHGVPVERSEEAFWQVVLGEPRGPLPSQSVAPPTDVSQRLVLASKGKAGRHRCMVLQGNKMSPGV